MLLKRHWVTSVVFFGLLYFLAGCATREPSVDTAAKDSLASGQSDSLTIELAGRDGVSVLELTLENHNVEYYESALGTFVKSIDSVASGDGYWWLFTVNDSAVNTASDKFMTNAGDVVKWHFKKP